MTTPNGPIVVDHAIGTAGSLMVRLASAEVRLVGTDGDRVVVRTSDGGGLPGGVIVETHDGIASIREKSGISLGRRRSLVELEIAVPSGADITTDVASGSVETDGLTGPQHYRTVSGETRLLRGAGRIELTTVSGDAAIELAGPADLAIRSISGDVRVDGGRLDALRVQTTSGDVRVDSPLIGRTGNAIETLSGDVDLVAGAGIRVEARTVSGDLSSDLPHRSDGRMGRRTLVVGDGAIELMFRSVSGDLRVHGSSGRVPTPPPVPPTPATPPTPPTPRTGWTDGPGPAGAPGTAPLDVGEPLVDEPLDDEHMAILRSLERGELDVATAMDRLSALDAASTTDRERADD